MLEKLRDESMQTEKIAMHMVNIAYPDTESLCLIKKKVEIIDTTKLFKKKRKFTLDAPNLSIRKGVLRYSGKQNEENLDIASTKKVKVEVHDKKRNEIRIHKFKVLLE